MPEAVSRGCALNYVVTDMTPPWRAPAGTVVFHHGLGANQGIWAEWVARLAARYRIVTFDMRGHGASARPAAGGRLDLDALTDDLFAVMDAAGVAEANLVGESIGGTIVLNAALRAPGRIESLTVSNGAHRGGSIQAVHDWGRILEEQGTEGWSRYMMGMRFFPGAIPADLAEWYEFEQARTCPRTLLDGVAALVAADLAPRLGDLRCPTLLLHPDSSPFIPVPLMVEFKEAVAGARLHVVGRARHGMPVSHAAECAMLLDRFLDEV